MSSWLKSYPSITAIGHNKERHQSLYAPFQSKTRNPDLYEEKQKFWIKAIEEFSTIERRFIFTIGDLESAFQVDQQVPNCLAEVVDFLRRRGNLLCEDDYRLRLSLTSKSRSISSWLYCAWDSRWLSWLGFISSLIAEYFPTNIRPLKAIARDTRLVYLPQLQLRMHFIQSSQLVNRILTSKELEEKIAYPDEAHLLLDVLRCEKQLATDMLGDTEIVKVLKTNYTSSRIDATATNNHGKFQAQGITTVEKMLFDVHRVKNKLRNHIVAELISKLKVLDDDILAKSFLQGIHGIKSLKQLKIAKTYRAKQLQFFRALYDNLCELSLQIEESKSDAIAWEIYETGKLATIDFMKENLLLVSFVPDSFWGFVEIFQRQLDNPGLGLTDPLSDQTSMLQDLEEGDEIEVSNAGSSSNKENVPPRSFVREAASSTRPLGISHW